MKLTYEDKELIFKHRKQKYSLKQLSYKFVMNISNLSLVKIPRM